MLFLKPGELGRAWPFFICYLLLFCAFSVADGLSQALFVKRVGVAGLPLYYGVTAVAERIGGLWMFQGILGVTVTVYAVAWVALDWLGGGTGWYGALFVTREVAF